MKIDSHQHFWKLERGDYRWLTPDLEVLYRDHSPGELRNILDRAGIDGTIAVQAADSEAETEYLLSLSDAHDWIRGVVGWTDLAAPDAGDAVARLARRRGLAGIRPMIQDIVDDAWMLGGSLGGGIEAMIGAGLVFDALVFPRHLGYLREFAVRYPGLRVVVDHCAKPRIGGGEFESWSAGLAEAARFENVFCKLSGLVTEAGANWTAADLRPYMSYARDIFGFERLLFGSDWPVVNLASSYGDWLGVARDFLCDASEAEVSAVMGGNALEVYGL
ncbi:MAG: amidohydrolase family protein [Alphaproteobacteria bacterium]|nr:amidohydrolase family protein [Alphaproteobacteria bacterium]MDA8008841.1 amidohydrolase family protein [Alphaproteobacteria bacterium]MDA8031429.1 amidohydrolase family protein [Alphaproteobacteria bacterium]